MPRLLVEGRWYDPVAPNSVYEQSFEDLVLERAAELYPDYHCVRYKRNLMSPSGATQADLALIHRDFAYWYVVEIEAATHSLSNHVAPQIERLTTAKYGYADAEWISSRNIDLDAARLRYMCEAVAPTVQVIVNAPVPGWAETLRLLGARLGVIEPFRDHLDRLVLRVNGEQPRDGGEIVTQMTRGEGWLGDYFRLENPAILPAGARRERILVEGQHRVARIKAMADGVYVSLGAAPAGRDVLYLVRTPQGLFAIEYEGSVVK